MRAAVALPESPGAHLAHHFETPSQQFESGKLGMWLFLATELLMFGGLFCAYAIYRGNHPEIFEYGHRFLDVKWGGINTLVLICSSFTMAWGVRCAQLGNRRLLILMLSITLACAATFMAIKYVEYSHKIRAGLLWGKHFEPNEHAFHGKGAAGHASGVVPNSGSQPGQGTGPGRAAGEPSAPVSGGSTIPRAALSPPGLKAPDSSLDEHSAQLVPKNAHIFFGLYFAMTGLHGIHVLAGMVVISWLLAGATAGRFGPHYFTPVDLVGLYWHVVDLIWIFLFPLLYLIH
jgi:cytochrome c oxidase subunit 3